MARLSPFRDKVFDTLVLLVEGAGSLQTQQGLIDRLWPDVSVEPNNLQHNISILRKALGDSAVQIETLRGRGYRLVAEVIRAPAAPRVSSVKHQKVHFCRTSDDVRLAWAELGEGPPIVKAGNWCGHLELDRSSLIWQHIMESFAPLDSV